jgi:putative transposase
LQELEAELLEDDQASLANALEVLLKDDPRPGVAPTFSPEQIVQIIALACENPLDSGFSFEYWTASELARQAQARGIVEHISPASVIRFLKRGLTQAAPHPLLAQSQRERPSRV